MGDAYFSPEIIARLWYQAETGKIPVSGAGYPGPFSGPGFDSMWTDMSEIVRPTRDGIHGREYISTAVDLGRTLQEPMSRMMLRSKLLDVLDLTLKSRQVTLDIAEANVETIMAGQTHLSHAQPTTYAA